MSTVQALCRVLPERGRQKQLSLQNQQEYGTYSVSHDFDARLIVLYQALHELTMPECRACRVPLSCCAPEYCEFAQEVASERWDVDLVPLRTNHPILPFMSEKDGCGCVISPHLRPLCTFHTCDVNSLGGKRGDLAWTDRYFKIRNEIEDLEYQKEFHDPA